MKNDLHPPTRDPAKLAKFKTFIVGLIIGATGITAADLMMQKGKQADEIKSNTNSLNSSHPLTASDKKNRENSQPEIGADNSKNNISTAEHKKPQFSLIAKGGRLTTSAVEAAQLTPEETEACEKILSDAWARAGEDLASRAKLEDKNSAKDQGTLSYKILAPADRGAEAQIELDNSIETAIGKNKFDILKNGASVDDFIQISRAFDINLKIDLENDIYKFEYLDPKTGKPVRSGTTVLSEFTGQFGSGFGSDYLPK